MGERSGEAQKRKPVTGYANYLSLTSPSRETISAYTRFEIRKAAHPAFSPL